MIEIVLAVLQIILAVGIVGFWIFFFKVENKDPEKEEWYLKHERSFPLPDLGLITVCLLIAAVGLLSGERFGIFFTIVAGGGLMFLGLIDLAFNLQNGLFKTKNLDAYMSIGIVSIVLIMGVLSLIYGYINF
ncbi:MAG: hypothetical protein HWN79_14710 [Candidatus Lokiarchaeota archaeon]|nr:hypothetical protein [Candidatus Lokiarchaeota archaeon]